MSIQEISQAQQLVGDNITIYAGMQAGLPLANPAQYGPIVKGQIFQALGNWEGVDQTLDLFIYPPTIGEKNLVLNWRANTPLSQALQVTLATAYPGMAVSVNISPRLVQNRDDVGPWPSLSDLAAWVRQRSVDIIGSTNYLGVAIAIIGNTITVYDNGVPPAAGTKVKTVDFKDLIGQPTWIDNPFISFKTVMRADINVGDIVMMPPALSVATPASLLGTPTKGRPTFAGTYQIQIVRHLGNFRQPDGASWCTVFNAYPVPAPQ